MTRKLFWMALILSFVFASGLAFAQEDDDAADDDAADDDAVDWVTFTDPAALEGNTEYEFTFSVFYNAEPEAKGLGIKQVDMNLPGTDYILEEEGQPAPPDCLNADCDRWEVYVDTENKSISWQSFGTVSTIEYGDIREQDVQTFAFIATTDDVPTDGFAWSLWGEDDSLVKEGVWFFGGDDDDIAPDDDTEPDDDDDNDDSGGCGC